MVTAKNNEAKQLVVFAYGLPCICFILAWRQYLKQGLSVWVESIVFAGAIVLLASILFPSVLKLMFKCWMKVAGMIGKFATFFLLAVFFFCIITPISIVLRVIGKGFVGAYFNEKIGSYWIKRDIKKEDYTKQF